MIKNKLKINDSKTEFIIFRSPLLKTDLSGVSIRVGDSQISSSSKVRDLGVIGYEPAGLTVHPPPQNDRGWVHFFRMGI